MTDTISEQNIRHCRAFHLFPGHFDNGFDSMLLQLLNKFVQLHIFLVPEYLIHRKLILQNLQIFDKYFCLVNLKSNIPAL